jgi:hypothetical protein
MTVINNRVLAIEKDEGVALRKAHKHRRFLLNREETHCSSPRDVV